MLVFIFYLLIIGAGTGGELCVSRAMKAVGEVKDFRPVALMGVITGALRVSWMWVGSEPDGDCILLPARGAVEAKRQFGGSRYSSELWCRRIGREILSRRTGHAEEVGGRASGLPRRRRRNHWPTVMRRGNWVVHPQKDRYD